MTATHMVPSIDIPSATADPTAYVDRLLEILSDRDPLEVLATSPVRAKELCADTPIALIEQIPEPDEWSAALVVGHMYDVDIVYGFRWRLVVTETDPVYPGYDEARWTPLARLPFWQTLDAWTGLRASNVALLRNIPRQDWQRTGRHDEQGAETMEVMIRKVAGHDLGHLNQLYRALRAARHAADLDVTALDAAYRAMAPFA
jgi:DinB superfamily